MRCERQHVVQQNAETHSFTGDCDVRFTKLDLPAVNLGQLMWCTEQDESSLLFIQLKTVDVHPMTNVVNASNQLLYIFFQDLRVAVEVQLSVVSIRMYSHPVSECDAVTLAQ